MLKYRQEISRIAYNSWQNILGLKAQGSSFRLAVAEEIYRPFGVLKRLKDELRCGRLATTCQLHRWLDPKSVNSRTTVSGVRVMSQQNEETRSWCIKARLSHGDPELRYHEFPLWVRGRTLDHPIRTQRTLYKVSCPAHTVSPSRGN